jgi:hypothetical protein
MPTLKKETGAGLADANSYADLDAAAAYVDARPYSSAWTGSDDDKKRFLIMATLMIDSMFRFQGFKANSSQALQWPRAFAPDPDAIQGAYRLPLQGTYGGYFPSNVVPPILVQATCEQALHLAGLTSVPTAPANAGIKEFEIAESIRVVFDSSTESSPPITSLVQQMLGRIASYQNSRGGNVRLTRA